MSEPKFTPGPWEARVDATTGVPYVATDIYVLGSDIGSTTLAVDAKTRKINHAERAANAALMAAAPDLYVALAELLSKIDDIDHAAIGDETDRVYASYEFDAARAALKKARGEV